MDGEIHQTTKAQSFSYVKVGDTVTRMLGGEIPMKLAVHTIENGIIYAGVWEFLVETGGEIDPDLGWDGKTVTGSFLVKE